MPAIKVNPRMSLMAHTSFNQNCPAKLFRQMTDPTSAAIDRSAKIAVRSMRHEFGIVTQPPCPTNSVCQGMYGKTVGQSHACLASEIHMVDWCTHCERAVKKSKHEISMSFRILAFVICFWSTFSVNLFFVNDNLAMALYEGSRQSDDFQIGGGRGLAVKHRDSTK